MVRYHHEQPSLRWMPRLQRVLANKGLVALSDPCSRYFHRHQRHLLLAVVIICVGSIITSHTIITASRKFREFVPEGELPEYESWQQNIDAMSGSALINFRYGTCSLQSPTPPSHTMNPILSASFPDGSSDLIRILIEATTGILTGTRNIRNDVVAVKTHHPYYDDHASVNGIMTQYPGANNSNEIIRALLVLRDPLDLMESWMNWIFNSVHKKDETSRASKDEWVAWRDVHIRSEIRQWDLFLRYWLDSVPPESRLIVVYDNIVDESTGPDELTDMVQFIRVVSDIPKVVPIQDVPCIWDKIINSSSKAERRRRLSQSSLPSGELSADDDNDRPYTFEHLDLIAGTLTKLINDYGTESKFIATLVRYKANVRNRMRMMKQVDPVMITNAMGICMVTTPIYEEMTPVFQASYPGSGSGMMRDLIEATTGVKTGIGKRRNDVISIQTSFPKNSKDIRPGYWNNDMKRAILLIRNPTHAITSYYSHIYWKENGLEPHSVQAPEHAWQEWRDKHFLKEVDAWVDHILYWTNRFDSTDIMIINFEALVDDGRGPRQATRLAMFLQGSNGEQDITAAPELTVPCLWFRAVKVNDDGSEKFLATVNSQSLSFTKDQLKAAASKLIMLYEKFNYDLFLGPVLKSYWEEIVELIPKNEEEEE